MGICYRTHKLLFSSRPTTILIKLLLHVEIIVRLKLKTASSELCGVCLEGCLLLLNLCSLRSRFVFSGAESNQMFLSEPLKLIAHAAVSFFTAVSRRSARHPHGASSLQREINVYSPANIPAFFLVFCFAVILTPSDNDHSETKPVWEDFSATEESATQKRRRSILC